ncbi:MAG: LPS assembly protein LptD [Thermodesulfobacteriota bacterium]
MASIVSIRNFLASLATFLLVFLCSPANGSDLLNQPWKVEADKISRGEKEQEVIAEGNVVLERTGNPDKPMTIQADWVRHDAELGVVEARGHVKLRSKTESADAEAATIYLGDETAQLINSKVFFQDTNIHFSSKEARKDGEMVYFFRDGVFTTCDFDDERRPVWSLSLKEADIDVDGFIFMKHSLLRIKDVPVFYLPYMAFPGRMERQSGFLDPEVSGSDRGGSGFFAPFFIDLSPSSDITIYPGYFASRGPMIGAEFRHIHDYESRFAIQATFIDDRLQDEVGDDYQDDGYLRTRSNRYWLRSKGDHDFGNDFKVLLDVDFASDRDYLMEFDEGVTGFEDSHNVFRHDFDRGLQEASLAWRSSSLQLAKHWSHVYLGGETTYVDDLNPSTTPNTTSIHTLPKVLTIGSLAIPATGINLNWNAEYINYWREEGVGMQRLDLHPRLTTPIPLGRWLEASATGGMRHTVYQVESYDNALYGGETSPTRMAWDGTVELATTFQRDFDLRVGSLRWFNHTIKPHTSYAYIDPDDDEDLLPDFDSKDRMVAQGVVGYGFENHFRIGGVDDKGLASNRYFGLFKAEHTYDHRKDIEPYGDLQLELDIYPLERLRVNYSTDLSVYGRGFVEYDLLTRYSNLRGDFLSVDYRYKKNNSEVINEDNGIHEINGSAQVRLTKNISLQGDIKKSLSLDNIVSQSVSLLYQPGCWGMQVKISESGDDRRVSVLLSLVALGQVLGIGYEENLGGDFEFATTTDPLEHESF